MAEKATVLFQFQARRAKELQIPGVLQESAVVF